MTRQDKNVSWYKKQGSHTSLKVLEYFSRKYMSLKVLENRTGA